MAAERDQAGEAGPGMSGSSRGTTGGSTPMGDRAGSAEVHTGLHSGGTGGDSYEGLQFAGHEEGTRSRLGGAADALRDRVGDVAGTVGSKASGAASTVRERANTLMEQRGILDRLRENPLPLLGVAFAIGFVIAGNDDDDRDDRPSRGSAARRELRGALMAGVSAGIAQGARGFLSQTGNQGSGFLNELLENVLGGLQGGSGASRGSTGGGSSSGGSAAGGSSLGGSRGTGSTAGAGSSRTGGASTGSTGSGGSAGGASSASRAGAGSSTGAGSSASTGAGSSGGSTGTSRPPSHQEGL